MCQEINRAKTYAFWLFKFRPRAEKELFFRLKKRKFNESTINKVIDDFKKSGLVNDAQFAEDWINARRQKGFGRRRIEFELKQKGINDELLEENKSLKFNEYSLALEVAKNQKKVLIKRKTTKEKIAQRLFAFLMRRGFSVDIIREVIQEVL